MNYREFTEWLRREKCEVEPREGLNNSMPPLVITNRVTGRYSYFAPLNYDRIPRSAIEKLIRDLGIQPPDGF